MNYSTVIESYKLTGRHTYFAMAVTSGCLLVLLLSLVVLHKDLAPASHSPAIARHKHVERLSSMLMVQSLHSYSIKC